MKAVCNINRQKVFAKLMNTNGKTRTEHRIPTANVRVRIRIREITKIFEKVTNKIEEHEQSANTKIFVRAIVCYRGLSKITRSF